MKSAASAVDQVIASTKVNGRAPFAPGNLHPGGFGCVPMQLPMHPECRAVHIAVYFAVASCADARTASCAPRLRRLAERSRCSERTVQGCINDLERWGFLLVERHARTPLRISLCPTAPSKPSENPSATPACSEVPHEAAADASAPAAPVIGTPCATPQIPVQIQINQTRGAASAGPTAPPAPGTTTTGEGASPPSPPMMSPALRAALEKRGFYGESYIRESVARDAAERGELAAVENLDRAMQYGLRPCARPSEAHS